MPYSKKATPATETFRGTVDSILGTTNSPVGSQRRWTRTDFLLVTADGQELSIATFNEVSQDLVGQEVQFDAYYQEKFDNYCVEGDIVLLSKESENEETKAEFEAAQTESAAPTVKRRGRPARTAASATVTTRTATKQTASVAASDRVVTAKPRSYTSNPSDVSSDSVKPGSINLLNEANAVARELVSGDVEYVKELLGDDAPLEAVAQIVATLQAARVSIFIDANQSKRAEGAKKSWNGNRGGYNRSYNSNYRR